MDSYLTAGFALGPAGCGLMALAESDRKQAAERDLGVGDRTSSQSPLTVARSIAVWGRALMLGGAMVSAMLVTACLADARIRYHRPNTTVPAGEVTRWTFGPDRVGSPPANYTIVRGVWSFEGDAEVAGKRSVLCQRSEAPAAMVVLGDMIYGNLVLRAQIGPLPMEHGHTAGLVFHVQDEENYYLVQVDAFAGTLDLYRVSHGGRIKLAGGGAAGHPDEWQEMRVEVTPGLGRSQSVRGLLGGRQIFQVTDDTFEAGKIGLLATGIGRICFERVEAIAG